MSAAEPAVAQPRGEARLAELDGWAPEQHAELEAVIAELSRDLASEPPVAPSS